MIYIPVVLITTMECISTGNLIAAILTLGLYHMDEKTPIPKPLLWIVTRKKKVYKFKTIESNGIGRRASLGLEVKGKELMLVDKPWNRLGYILDRLFMWTSVAITVTCYAWYFVVVYTDVDFHL